MAGGRPLKSVIRQHIVDILYCTGSGYGYDIYGIYREVYPAVTMRSIYYHLKKGLETGEFKVEKIQKEQGEYSWGGEAEKTYYSLGKNAAAHGDFRLRLFLDRRKVKKEHALQRAQLPAYLEVLSVSLRWHAPCVLQSCWVGLD